MASRTPPHPVIIAGAGPCGLVAALTLKKSGIPFLIYERASSTKLCSNAGSGIDMAPTALQILEEKLGLSDGLDKAMRPYEYMDIADMDGGHVKTFRLKELNATLAGRGFGFASRSMLQHALLDALGLKDGDDNVIDDSEGVLRCGVTVTEYENKQNTDNGSEYKFVEVKLDNGTTVNGSALLACDGIHSRVRQCMYKEVPDHLSYCGQVCWWGKLNVTPGDEIDREVKRIAEERNMQDGNIAHMVFGTKDNPFSFFTCEVRKNMYTWLLTMEKKEAPLASSNESNDLTRRGGTTLDTGDKQRDITKLVANSNKLVKLFMEETPAEDFTHSGFFDRANLNLGYVDGLVALLGDAAHPQSPMMGQGANMAMVDGYVVATRLSSAFKKNGSTEHNNDHTLMSSNIHQALVDFDSKERRKENNVVIRKARKYGQWWCSRNGFVRWVLRTATKFMSGSMIFGEVLSGDKSNEQFLAAMNEDGL